MAKSTTLIGKSLKKGDTIGIVAPASNISSEQISKAAENLKNLGYNIVFNKNCFKNWNSFSGNDKERAKGINDFFKDPKIDAIMCLRGGYGSLRILDLIDYEAIKANPKVFIGFSDITSLHAAIFKMTNLVTFHGPMLVSNFSDKNYNELTIESLFKLIENSSKSYQITNPNNEKFKLFKTKINTKTDKKTFSGKTVGGNLITFLSLIGSKYEIDLKDKILVIEEIGEYTYKIDRMLSQLEQLKNFHLLSGIILCDFNSCDKDCEEAFSLSDLFKDKFKNLNIPIISDVKSGHCHPMVTIPLGANVEIDISSKTIKVKGNLVK